jgi:uncharacterized protein
MVGLLKHNMVLIQDVCKKHHVKSLYLIGSATGNEEDFGKDSDVDFIYVFDKNRIAELDYADNYFNLLFSLQDILHRKVDLVPEEKISNPFFRNSINQTKLVIYAA